MTGIELAAARLLQALRRTPIDEWLAPCHSLLTCSPLDLTGYGPRRGFAFDGVALSTASSIKNAMAFFDGQNLYPHAMAAFSHHHPNYDPIKLHRAVCLREGLNATLTRFYTGVPSILEDPQWGAYWNNRVLHMKRQDIHICTRELRYREKEAYNKDGKLEVFKVAQEKGIIDKTQWMKMDREFYDACLDPKDYRPKTNRAS